jgi:hypothetical protein
MSLKKIATTLPQFSAFLLALLVFSGLFLPDRARIKDTGPAAEEKSAGPRLKKTSEKFFKESPGVASQPERKERNMRSARKIRSNVVWDHE